jgi:tetratricopeptide (TPR) repeat protein
LFVSSLPEDLPEEEKFIELEKEQERLIEAIGNLVSEKKVLVEFMELGSLEEIEKSLENGKHHIVHISGHGKFLNFISSKLGILYLEKEGGDTEVVSGFELAEVLRRYNSIKMVMLSACETGRAEEFGIAGALVKGGIPVVVGMHYSITDSASTLFTSTFYDGICKGNNIGTSLFIARKRVLIWQEEQIKIRQGNGNFEPFPTEWFNPFLYLNQNVKKMIDYSKNPSDIQYFFKKPINLLEGGKYVGRGFIGRKKEILRLSKFFKEGNHAVCIYGQGGTGKTTLAIRFADNFESGTFKIIQFIGEVNEEIILKKLAEEAEKKLGDWLIKFINSPDYSPEHKLNILIDQYLSKEKLIILFDNFEENQMEYKENKIYQTEIHSDLLKKFLIYFCNTLKKTSYILFTTRYLFYEPKIISLNLSEMNFPDIFKMINRFECLVQLTLNEKREIHQKLGGHPRALELLESYIKNEKAEWSTVNLKIKDVVEIEVNHNLLMDMLWEKLDTEERHVLKVASIFRRQISLLGLTVVTGFKKEETKTFVDTLNALSLAYVEDSSCYIHRLTSNFVQSTKMNQNEIKQINIQTAKYYNNITVDKGKRYIENDMEARWHYLEAEEWDQAVEVTFCMESYLTSKGYPQLSLELFNEFYEKDISEKNKSILYHGIGNLYFGFGRFDGALKHYEKSLEICDKIGDMKSASESLHNIGTIYQDKGDYDTALKKYEKARETFEKFDDIKGISYCLHSIGNIYYLKSDYDTALKQYEKARKTLEKIDDIKGVCYSLAQIATIHKDRGDYDKALNQYKKLLKIFEESGDIKDVSTILHLIGMIYQEMGDYDAALKHYEESRDIDEKMGNMKGVTDSLHNIGALYRAKGDYDGALKICEDSKEIYEKIGDIKGVSYSLHQIGMIYEDKGDYDAALKNFKKSLELKKKIGDIKGASDSLHSIGTIHQSKGDYKTALKLYEKSLEICDKIGDILGKAITFGQIGRLYLEKNEFANALRFLIKAFLIFSKMGSHSVRLAERHILSVRNKMPEKQFNDILKEFNISPDIFNDIRDDKLHENKFMDFLMDITADTIAAKEKSQAEKEYIIQLLNDLLNKLLDSPEYGDIKAYLQMLLNYVQGQEIEKYIQKIPLELMSLFENVIAKKKRV